MKYILYPVLAVILLSALLYLIFIPDTSVLKKEDPKKTSLMEYREAEWAAKGKKKKAVRNWVPYSRISPYLVKAVIIAEDDKFWSHEGFDFEAMQKAFEKDLKAGKFKAGGSTISQQLAKNLYLTPEKSVFRKIREAVITRNIERELSKKRIIEIYLNIVEWGEGIFGAEAASRHYFGKSASELTPMEAARLASVLPNPRKFSPVKEQRYVVNRSNFIYRIMLKRGIAVPEYEEISAEEISQESPQPDALFEAPLEKAAGVEQSVAPEGPVAQ